MAEALQDVGYEVMEAYSGVQALRFLNDPPRRFTLLLTDLHMSGRVDGAQVATRARQVFPTIPVIIASGRPDVLEPRWQRELGYQLLKKPYLPSEMVGIVRALIGRPT